VCCCMFAFRMAEGGSLKLRIWSIMDDLMTSWAAQGVGAGEGVEEDLEVGTRSVMEDAFVVAERERVDSCPPGTDAITISHLHKAYPGTPPKVKICTSSMFLACASVVACCFPAACY